MPVRVSVDLTKAVEGLHALQRDQIPFALAKTLSKLAYGAQAKAREDIDAPGTRFQLRNRFTQQSIKVKPAQKNSAPIEAAVYTDPRAGYLGLQESGGERVPVNGRQHLATPTKYLFNLIGGSAKIIPTAYRPAAMLAYADSQGKTYRNRKGGISRTPSGPLRGLVFFLATLKSGTLAIMARTVGDARDAYPMYYLVSERLIQQRFGLEGDVRDFVTANYEAVWREVWQEINLAGIRIRV